MKLFKKLLAVAMVAVLALTVLTGCDAGDASEVPSNATDASVYQKPNDCASSYTGVVLVPLSNGADLSACDMPPVEPVDSVRSHMQRLRKTNTMLDNHLDSYGNISKYNEEYKRITDALDKNVKDHRVHVITPSTNPTKADAALNTRSCMISDRLHHLACNKVGVALKDTSRWHPL